MNKILPEFYCPYTDNCSECCLETEMTLSEKDITRIESLGYKIEEFLEEKEGFMTLKNIDKQCFFLKDGLCSIYDNRPYGCRFYPLIYDFELDEFIIDNLCAHGEDFDPDIYQPLHEPIASFVYTLLSEKEIREEKQEKLKEKEEKN